MALLIAIFIGVVAFKAFEQEKRQEAVEDALDLGLDEPGDDE